MTKAFRKKQSRGPNDGMRGKRPIFHKKEYGSLWRIVRRSGGGRRRSRNESGSKVSGMHAIRTKKMFLHLIARKRSGEKGLAPLKEGITLTCLSGREGSCPDFTRNVLSGKGGSGSFFWMKIFPNGLAVGERKTEMIVPKSLIFLKKGDRDEEVHLHFEGGVLPQGKGVGGPILKGRKYAYYLQRSSEAPLLQDFDRWEGQERPCGPRRYSPGDSTLFLTH